MAKKLKIGILINQNKKLNDGEIKTISEILESNYINIDCLFCYNEETKSNQSVSFIYNCISKVEKRYSVITRDYQKRKIKKKFSIIKKKIIKLEKDNINLTLESLRDSVNKLDVLICFDANHLLNSKIINLPKYGAWVINYGVKNNIFAGFWECFKKKGVTRIILERIEKNKFSNNKITIIDQGFYSTKTSSWFLNREFVFDKSCSLILKNLKLLYLKNVIKIKKESYKSNKNPNLILLFLYILKKYPKALLRNFIKIFFNLKKYNKNYEPNFNPWNLHIGKKNKSNKFKLELSNRIKPRNGEEWADPFLISDKNDHYLFFENFEFSNQKGKISFSKLENNKITKIFDALNLNYHLSYPFLWKEKNNFFMIPETAEKKCIQIWKAKKFPRKWILYKTLFKGQSFVDTTIFDDKKGNRWIFTNKSSDKFNDHNSELYIYKTDKKFKKFTPHILNPVITDSRFARNAGNIYYNNRGLIIRPSQRNTHNFYGTGLNLRVIEKLSIREFIEKDYASYYPNFKEKINAIHHITQNKNYYAVDLKYKNFFYNFIPQNY